MGNAKGPVVFGRLDLVLAAIAVLAIAVVEWMVALNMEFTRPLAMPAMWAGTILATCITADGWVRHLIGWESSNGDNIPLALVVTFTILAVFSARGILPDTTGYPLFFARVVNVWAWSLFLFCMREGFLKSWRRCATVSAE